MDDLFSQLPPHEVEELKKEPHYLNIPIVPGMPLPFVDEEFDGVLLSHFLEHFDIQESLKILRECHRVLDTRNGLIAVSVPNASYFKRVRDEDRNENWPALFEVSDPKNPIPTFMEAALFFEQHKVLFTRDSMWCLLRQAGFFPFRPEGMTTKHTECRCYPTGEFEITDQCPQHYWGHEMVEQFNRRKFSLEMLARKI